MATDQFEDITNPAMREALVDATRRNMEIQGVMARVEAARFLWLCAVTTYYTAKDEGEEADLVEWAQKMVKYAALLAEYFTGQKLKMPWNEPTSHQTER
jgi:hypothetical protein